MLSMTDDEFKTEEPEKELTELERAEKAVLEMKDLVKRNEEILAKKILGGIAEAGQPEPEKKEETPAEYKDRVIAGEI